MRVDFRNSSLIPLVMLSCFFGVTPLVAGEQVARSRQAVVASVHPLATDAGIAALRAGGNALDAAVAAAVTLGVVDSHNSGLGGGCFILARLADGTFLALDGREMAPAAATRDMFLVNGKPDTRLSQTGPLAVGVPGALAAYGEAIEKYGKLTLTQLMTPAARLAEEGFPIDRNFAGVLRRNAPQLRRFPGTAAVLLPNDGQPLRESQRLRQPDLARTYRCIAEQGTDWFYQGELAEKVGAWMAAHGGVLTAQDFADYHTVTRTPIRTAYRGYEVVCFPPPSSGGVHLAQMLNILESFDLAEMHRADPLQATHVIGETMKLAFADRAYWLGDADFVAVPRGLISKAYAKTLASRIDVRKAIRVVEHGTPADAATAVFGKHTTHIAAADAEGNWVAITATVNTSFGSKVIVPGTGLVLNNEMDDFSIQPGVPNAFGLIGAENNAVAPGKRPLSSMCPAIVLEDGQPIMTVGAAGGPKIITQSLLAIVRCLDFGESLEQAVAGKRFHHQWRPDSLMVEHGTRLEDADTLMNMGHAISYLTSAGVTQAIRKQPDGTLVGVHDPRIPGKAAGL